MRAEVGKPLQAARDLFKQGKYKEALAKLREAEAVPNRTASENHLIEQMRAAIASQAGDTEQAIKASQALITSGKLSEADQARDMPRVWRACTTATGTSPTPPSGRTRR